MELILKYTLKKIQEQLTLIPAINQGGCCCVAKLLAKELEKRNIKYQVLLYNYWFGNSKDVINAIKSRKLIIDSVSHVALKINNLHVDGVEMKKNSSDLASTPMVKTSKLNYSDLQYYYNHANWNFLFKKYQSSKISKIIKNQFKIYDKLKTNE